MKCEHFQLQPPSFRFCQAFSCGWMVFPASKGGKHAIANHSRHLFHSSNINDETFPKFRIYDETCPRVNSSLFFLIKASVFYILWWFFLHKCHQKFYFGPLVPFYVKSPVKEIVGSIKQNTVLVVVWYLSAKRLAIPQECTHCTDYRLVGMSSFPII